MVLLTDFLLHAGISPVLRVVKGEWMGGLRF